MSSQPRRSSKKRARKKSPAWGIWIGLFAGACLVAVAIWGISKFVLNRTRGPEGVVSGTNPEQGSTDGSGKFDYVAQLDREQAVGATPENNLAVVVAQIGGSELPTPELHAEFEKRLGVSVPQQTRTALHPAAADPIRRDMTTFQFAPWATQDYPAVAKYLEQIQGELDQLVTASARCTHFYWPRMADRTEEGMRFSPTGSMSATHVGIMTAAIRALAVRSLMKYEQGQLAEALQDASASLRLGNLLSHGRLSMEQIGANHRTHALRAMLPIINSDRVTLEQLVEMEAVLENSPVSPLSETDVVNAERIMMLDIVAAVAKQGMDVLTPDSAGPKLSIPLSALTSDKVDYDEARRLVNHWVDRVQAEVAIKRPANLRNAAILAIDFEIKANMKTSKSQARDRTEAGSRLGEVVFATQSYFSPLMQSRETYETYRELMILAIQLRKSALAGKGPPATLAEFLAEARPRDRFTGEEIIYRAGRVGNQFYIYSRGSNGTDDGALMPFADWVSMDDLGLIIYWKGFRL